MTPTRREIYDPAKIGEISRSNISLNATDLRTEIGKIGTVPLSHPTRQVLEEVYVARNENSTEALELARRASELLRIEILEFRILAIHKKLETINDPESGEFLRLFHFTNKLVQDSRNTHIVNWINLAYNDGTNIDLSKINWNDIKGLPKGTRDYSNSIFGYISNWEQISADMQGISEKERQTLNNMGRILDRWKIEGKDPYEQIEIYEMGIRVMNNPERFRIQPNNFQRLGNRESLFERVLADPVATWGSLLWQFAHGMTIGNFNRIRSLVKEQEEDQDDMTAKVETFQSEPNLIAGNQNERGIFTIFALILRDQTFENRVTLFNELQSRLNTFENDFVRANEKINEFKTPSGQYKSEVQQATLLSLVKSDFLDGAGDWMTRNYSSIVGDEMLALKDVYDTTSDSDISALINFGRGVKIIEEGKDVNKDIINDIINEMSADEELLRKEGLTKAEFERIKDSLRQMLLQFDGANISRIANELKGQLNGLDSLISNNSTSIDHYITIGGIEGQSFGKVIGPMTAKEKAYQISMLLLLLRGLSSPHRIRQIARTLITPLYTIDKIIPNGLDLSDIENWFGLYFLFNMQTKMITSVWRQASMISIGRTARRGAGLHPDDTSDVRPPENTDSPTTERDRINLNRLTLRRNELFELEKILNELGDSEGAAKLRELRQDAESSGSWMRRSPVHAHNRFYYLTVLNIVRHRNPAISFFFDNSFIRLRVAANTNSIYLGEMGERYVGGNGRVDPLSYLPTGRLAMNMTRNNITHVAHSPIFQINNSMFMKEFFDLVREKKATVDKVFDTLKDIAAYGQEYNELSEKGALEELDKMKENFLQGKIPEMEDGIIKRDPITGKIAKYVPSHINFGQTNKTEFETALKKYFNGLGESYSLKLGQAKRADVAIRDESKPRVGETASIISDGNKANTLRILNIANNTIEKIKQNTSLGTEEKEKRIGAINKVILDCLGIPDISSHTAGTPAGFNSMRTYTTTEILTRLNIAAETGNGMGQLPRIADAETFAAIQKHLMEIRIDPSVDTSPRTYTPILILSSDRRSYTLSPADRIEPNNIQQIRNSISSIDPDLGRDISHRDLIILINNILRNPSSTIDDMVKGLDSGIETRVRASNISTPSSPGAISKAQEINFIAQKGILVSKIERFGATRLLGDLGIPRDTLRDVTDAEAKTFIDRIYAPGYTPPSSPDAATLRTIAEDAFGKSTLVRRNTFDRPIRKFFKDSTDADLVAIVTKSHNRFDTGLEVLKFEGLKGIDSVKPLTYDPRSHFDIGNAPTANSRENLLFTSLRRHLEAATGKSDIDGELARLITNRALFPLESIQGKRTINLTQLEAEIIKKFARNNVRVKRIIEAGFNAFRASDPQIISNTGGKSLIEQSIIDQFRIDYKANIIEITRGTHTTEFLIMHTSGKTLTQNDLNKIRMELTTAATAAGFSIDGEIQRLKTDPRPDIADLFRRIVKRTF